MVTLEVDYEELRRSIAGEVLERTSSRYDAARAMWSGAVDRFPAAIAQCTSTDDVAAAVRFAAKAGLPLTVRGGGHGFSGLAISDDSLLIDTSRMRRIEIDRGGRTARAQPGVLGGEFDSATLEMGLATTLGTVSHTGIAGLTLGGGWGYLMRSFGLACDNLLSAEVVLADGEVVRADKDTNPDLFWALRGGGGNFGAVTTFEYALHPAAPDVTLSQWVFPPDAGPAPLQTARDIAKDENRDRHLFMASMCIPDLHLFPPQLRGERAYLVLCLSLDRADEDGRWMEVMAEHEPLLGGTVQAPYVGLQSFGDGENPHGLLAHCKGALIADLSDEAIATFVEYAERLPGKSLMYLQQMGGAVADVAEGETPVGGRDADYLLNVITRWTDEQGEAAAREFAHDAVAAFESSSLDIVPLNFEGDPIGLDASIYGSALPRLREIKEKYDPRGVFGGGADDRGNSTR